MAKQIGKGNGKAKRLTTEEAREFVQQSNAAVFGPGPEGFVSKHRFAASDVAARVRAIDWFAHCGEPCYFDLTMAVERVKTWSQATKADKSLAWENAILEARNQLTEFLSLNHPERDREWNKITDKLKSKVVMPLTRKVWEPFRKSRDLDVTLVHSVQWNILSVLMENAFMDCQHGCFFFHELLTVYEAGHLPCGWKGEWPQGKLVVF
jgi:hypothetical protein